MTIGERIVGELVTLAPLDPADAPAWARWLADPETTRYLYGRRGPPDRPATTTELRSWGRHAHTATSASSPAVATRCGCAPRGCVTRRRTARRGARSARSRAPAARRTPSSAG